MESKIIRCGHCNNLTPHEILLQTEATKLYEGLFEDQEVFETFEYHLVRCGTCNNISLLGGFQIELPQYIGSYPRLYPRTEMSHGSIPQTIRNAYEEASRIRIIAPNAYAGQIRRSLEYLCKNKKAKGDNLSQKLKSLSDAGILPSTLTDMTTIIREIGNTGVHAGEEEVTVWDTELIDEFFISVVNYVYVAPFKIWWLKQKLASKKQNKNSNKSE